MKSSSGIRLFFVAATTAVVGTAWAWIDTGHMVVAAIAESKLTPAATKALERLVKIGTDVKTNTFVTVSCYPDDFKNDEDRAWHYINYHFRSDGKETSNKPEDKNVVWAIEKFTAVLENAKAPDNEKAQAIRYLVHFVGDIHQPMHAIARDTDAFPAGDRGGNDFKIKPIEGWGDRPVGNLHALWDFGCGEFKPIPRPLSPEGLDKIKSIAKSITDEYPEDKLGELGSSKPGDWVNESCALAKTQAYALGENSTPSEDYLKRGRETCRRRAALAGYRLASVLNRVFK